MDQMYSALVDAVLREARRAGIAISVDGIDDGLPGGMALAAMTSVQRQNRWDRIYEVTISALPGGPRHMAIVGVAVTPQGGPESIQMQQVRKMLTEHVSRQSRIDAIRAAGLDPCAPPAWSIESYAATLAVMRALGGEVDSLQRFTPDNAGVLEATVPGLHDLEAKVSIRDSILEWATHIGVDREWSYNHFQRELRILDRQLPETVCQAIQATRMRVCEIIDDDVLGGITTIVERARNEPGCIVLGLAPGWEWLAPVPAGTSGDWRTP